GEYFNTFPVVFVQNVTINNLFKSARAHMAKVAGVISVISVRGWNG
ncbi:15583_t:CDS:1, partial [Funneliformis caledonium]